MTTYDLLIGLATIVLLGIAVWQVLVFLRQQRVLLQTTYAIPWQPARRLDPSALLHDRPYVPYYHERDEDRAIRTALAGQRNLLVLGRPLAGKTRALYEALKALPVPTDVLAPVCADLELEHLHALPRRLASWRRGVVVIDDLHRFSEMRNFGRFVRLCVASRVPVAAACQSGEEYDHTRLRFIKAGIELGSVFGGNVVALGSIEEDAAREAARRSGRSWEEVAFDGTIGSVFVPLVEMTGRFGRIDPKLQAVLRVLRSLQVCGAFRGRAVFPVPWLRTAAGVWGLEGRDYEWRAWLEELRRLDFAVLGPDGVHTEEAYLDHVVVDGMSDSRLDILRRFVPAFGDVPEVLIRIANRIIETKPMNVELPEYLELARAACTAALRSFTIADAPADYAAAQHALGTVHASMGEFHDRAVHSRAAIAAYQEALRVHTVERMPMQYALTQNNLGNAYRSLAEAEERGPNCRQAIAAFERALGVYTAGNCGECAAMVQNNLGNAYGRLAEVEERGPNCRRAIAAYTAALAVRTRQHSPFLYAMTQNNLGNVYLALAEIEDTAGNCRRAIAAYTESLTVRTRANYPTDHAMTMNNLGSAYRKLAEVEDTAGNCRRAVAAHEAAIEVYTAEKFPYNRAVALTNLGNALVLRATVEDPVGNRARAVQAYEEALPVLKREHDTTSLAEVEQGLARARSLENTRPS